MLEGKDYLVIDDLVPNSFLDAFLNDLYARDHWAFSIGTLDKSTSQKYEGIFADNPMLTSTFFTNEAGIVNPLFSELRTIFYFLEHKTGYTFDLLGRVKANLSWPQTSVTKGPNPPHIDVPQEEFLSMVFYVNDADGDTILYDKRVDEGEDNLKELARITPKAGRAVIFHSNRFHSSSPPVNYSYRIIINTVFSPKVP